MSTPAIVGHRRDGKTEWLVDPKKLPHAHYVTLLARGGEIWGPFDSLEAIGKWSAEIDAPK